MREIKFRAWDAVTLAMYKVSTLINNGRVGVVIAGCAPFYKDNTIIMQYTGLKDKNDKEIYEGDIYVLSTLEEDGDRETSVVEDIRDTLRLGGYMQRNPDTLEVIGNIYENPELLESGK